MTLMFNDVSTYDRVIEVTEATTKNKVIDQNNNISAISLCLETFSNFDWLYQS